MPRTLPWATSHKPSTDKFTALPSPRPVKRRRIQAEADSDSDTPAVPLRRQHEFNKHYPGVTGFTARDRSPSTSPPPTPPDLAFMRADGQDDEWIMVEDEFMSTAQQFTKHLHHAAYQQRKAEAAQRALTGHSSAPREASQAKTHLVEKLASKHGQVTERAGSEEAEEGDDLIIGDRRLAGLMFANGVGGKGKTRLDGLVDVTASHGHTQTKGANGTRRVQIQSYASDDTDGSVNDCPGSLPKQFPAKKSPGRTSSPLEHRPAQGFQSPTKPIQSSPGLGASIFGRSEPQTPAIQKTSSSAQTNFLPNLDEDGLPKRRQAPSLAELRKERAAVKAKTGPHRSPGRSYTEMPNTPCENDSLQAHTVAASPSVGNKTPRCLTKVKEDPVETQDVVPLFLG